MNKSTEKIRKRIIELIESEYESDAAFERALGLGEKTVNNWRRARSASFMRMLPILSETFGVSVSELLDIPLADDTSELSPSEKQLLELYRKSRPLPEPMRHALAETIERTINAYITAYTEVKRTQKKKPGRKPEQK